MRRKVTILIGLILIIASTTIVKSTLGAKAEDTDMDMEARVDEEPEEGIDGDKNNETLDDEPSEPKEKDYIGEAYDQMERIGEVRIYSDKDKDSEIIHVLKDHEEVKLLKAVPYGWFEVELEDGQVGYVDSRYIRTKEIPPHDYDEDSEDWVIIFSDEDQEVDIYHDGELVKESKASGGLWDSFTPKGIFQVEPGRRGEWFFAERFQQGGKYWVGFKDTFLFHSLPYHEDQTLIEEEAKKLGEPSSHGCIRLPVDVAEYIYENIPDGSLVIIE